MAETGNTMENESQNEGAYTRADTEAPSLESNPTSEKEIQDTAEHPVIDESGDSLAPLQNSSEATASAEVEATDSDTGATDSEGGITDSEPIVTDSEPIVTDSETGATDSEVAATDSETGGTEPTGPPAAVSVEADKPEETTGDIQATHTDLPSKEIPAEGQDNTKKESDIKDKDPSSAGGKTDDTDIPKHRRPVIDASKLKDKSDRQKTYRNHQLQLQKKSIDQQRQTKDQKRQAVEERRKKQEEEKKVHREAIVRRSLERSQSAGSREKRRSWDPAKEIPSSAPPRGRSMERLNDTPNEALPAGVGVNKRLSSSVSTLWNPVQLVRLGPNQDDWFEVHTPRPKELRSPSPGIDDSNSSTYTPRHHSSSPNLALNTSWVRNTLEALIELPPHVQVFDSAEYPDHDHEICEEHRTASDSQKHRYASSTASSRSRAYATRRRYRAATSQNKSSPSTPKRRTPTSSRGRSTERKTPSPAQTAVKASTPETAAKKTQRPPSPKGFRAPSPKPSTGTPTSSSNSSMHVRQPSLRLKNSSTVDGKSPADKTSKTPVSKSSQPPPIKKALTPAKSSPTRTPRTSSTNNKTPTTSKTPTTTRTSTGSRTPTTMKTPTSKPAASKTPTKPAAAKASPTTPKATPIEPKATSVSKATPKATPKAATTPIIEEAPKPDVVQIAEPEKKSPDSGTRSPPAELSAEERAKQALAEKRRQMREKAEREAELERQRKEQEEREEEERLRREEEERIKEEEEQQRLAEEYTKAEEERLQKAIVDQQRREEEEKLQMEEKEEEERVKAEEWKKRDEDLTEQLKKNEEARDARKKRVDEIMKRARRSTPAVKNDDDHDNRDEDKDIDTQADKENGIEDNIFNNDNDKYRNCFGNGSAVASHETLSGEMEQDMEDIQEGVMGEDDTAYGVRDDSAVVPEGGYLEGISKEDESEGGKGEARSGGQFFEKAMTEEVGEKEDDVMLMSKERDDSCEFENQEEALVGEIKQQVKFAEIVAMPTHQALVESEVPVSENEAVGVETELASDNNVAAGDLIGGFESDSTDGNVFTMPKLESSVEFDPLGIDVDKGLAGGNDGSSVDVLESLHPYNQKSLKLVDCRQESDAAEDDDSTAAQAGDVDTSTGDGDISAGDLDPSAGDVDISPGDVDPSAGDVGISAGDVDPSAGDVDIRHPCDLHSTGFGFDTRSNFEDFASGDRMEIVHDSQGLQDIHEESSEEEEGISDQGNEIKNEDVEVENVEAEESDLLQSCSSDRFIVIDEKSLQEGDLDSGDELVNEGEEELPQDDDRVIPVVETSPPVDDAEVIVPEDEEIVEAPKDVGTIPEITLDEVECVHQNSSGDEEVMKEEMPLDSEGQHRGDSEDEGMVEENLEAFEEVVDEEEDVEDHDDKLDISSEIAGLSHFNDSVKDEPEAIDVVASDEVVEGSDIGDNDARKEELIDSSHSSLEDAIEVQGTTETGEDEYEEDQGSPRLDELGVSTRPNVDDHTKPEESYIVETEGVIDNREGPSSSVIHRDDVDSHSSSDDSDVESPGVKKVAFFEGDRGNLDYLAHDRVVSQSSEDKEREYSSSSSSSSDDENESNKKKRNETVEENVFDVDTRNLGYLGDEERAQSSSPDIASRSPRVDDAERLEFYSSASETEDATDTLDSFPEVSSLNATRGSPIDDMSTLEVQPEEGVFEEHGSDEGEHDDAVDGDKLPEEAPELDARELEYEENESGEPSSSLEVSGEILLDTDNSLADVKPQFEDEQTPDEEEQLSYDESSSDTVPAMVRVDDECVEKEDVSCPEVVGIGEEGKSPQEILLSNQHLSGEDHNGNYSSEDEEEEDVDSVIGAEQHVDREENGMNMGGRQLTSSPSTNSTSSSEGSYTANPVDYHKNDDLIHTNDSPNTLHDQQNPVKHIGEHQDHYPGKESSIVLDAVMEDDDGLNGKSAEADEEDVSVSTEL